MLVEVVASYSGQSLEGAIFVELDEFVAFGEDEE
jgi:hypothetical protein